MEPLDIIIFVFSFISLIIFGVLVKKPAATLEVESIEIVEEETNPGEMRIKIDNSLVDVVLDRTPVGEMIDCDLYLDNLNPFTEMSKIYAICNEIEVVCEVVDNKGNLSVFGKCKPEKFKS